MTKTSASIHSTATAQLPDSNHRVLSSKRKGTTEVSELELQVQVENTVRGAALARKRHVSMTVPATTAREEGQVSSELVMGSSPAVISRWRLGGRREHWVGRDAQGGEPRALRGNGGGGEGDTNPFLMIAPTTVTTPGTLGPRDTVGVPPRSQSLRAVVRDGRARA